jgi:hypothetical protein
MTAKILLPTSVAMIIGLSGVAAAAGINQSTNTSGMQSDTHMHTVMLRAVTNPKETLANASVDDSAGSTIGHVQSVETYKSGHARAVLVSLTSDSKTVAIPQRDLRFDKSTDTLDAKLTKSQIEALSSHS